jgi:hypothetical protein
VGTLGEGTRVKRHGRRSAQTRGCRAMALYLHKLLADRLQRIGMTSWGDTGMTNLPGHQLAPVRPLPRQSVHAVANSDQFLLFLVLYTPVIASNYWKGQQGCPTETNLSPEYYSPVYRGFLTRVSPYLNSTFLDVSSTTTKIWPADCGCPDMLLQQTCGRWKDHRGAHAGGSEPHFHSVESVLGAYKKTS